MNFSRTVDIRQIIDRLYLRYGPNAQLIEMMSSFILSECPITRTEIRSRLEEIEKSKLALTLLLKRSSITQRTPEWYEARMGMITASDIAQALGAGKFGTQKQLLWKKCMASTEDTFAALANCPPIKWGTMYEDVAQGIYCKRNRVKMHEFGLLSHPTTGHIGASPDGISELGVMLEIKCPYRREITGEVPLQYYYQIQGQLEVCGLEECDFLELGLKEMSRADFYTMLSGLSEAEMGIVAELTDPDTSKSMYQYSGVDWQDLELEAFEASFSTDVKFHYWRVNKYSCVRVIRDHEFIKKMLPEISAVWAQIETYRSDVKLMEAEIGLPPLPKAPRSSSSEFAFRTTPAFAFR